MTKNYFNQKNMKYFILKDNKWTIANKYIFENSKQINLFDFCEKKQKMIFVGIGLY